MYLDVFIFLKQWVLKKQIDEWKERLRSIFTEVTLVPLTRNIIGILSYTETFSLAIRWAGHFFPDSRRPSTLPRSHPPDIRNGGQT